MAETTKTATIEAVVPEIAKEVRESEIIPSHDELALENYLAMDMVLVQWIGSKTVYKLAPSPSGASRKLGSRDYGLIGPKQFLLVHKEDAKFTQFYHRPTAEEKPNKSEVKLTVSDNNMLHVRVTWPGMPKDELDRFSRR